MPSPRRVGVIVASALVAALVLPVLWSVLRTPDFSSGDVALIELRVREVLAGDRGLVGAYSRFGWSHPGPLLFIVFALPYRVFGGDTDALRLTALLVNALVIALTIWLASRRGRAAVGWAAIAIVGLVWGMDARALADGWNVTIAVLPMVLITVACWSALVGDGVAVLVAALSFAFVLQAHVGFGVVAAPLVLATVGWCTSVAVRRRDGRALRGLAIVAACFVVSFLPAIYDVMAHWPGNLGRLVSWSVRRDEPSVGLADAVRVVGRASSSTFLRHPQAPTFFFTVDVDQVGVIPGLVVLLVVAGLLLCWRRTWRAERLLCTTIVILWMSGVVAAASIAEPLEVWLIQWTRPLAWMSWATVALVAWRYLQAVVAARSGSLPIGAGRLGAAVVGGATAVLIVGSVFYARASGADDPQSTARRRAVVELAAGATPVAAPGPIRIDVDGDRLGSSIMMAGVVNELDRRGYDVCVDASFEYQYGPRRVCDGAPRPRVVLRSERRELPAPDRTEVVAIADALTPDRRREADSITAELSDVLTAHGLAAQLPLLESALVDVLLEGRPPPAIVAERPRIERLQELRRDGSERYGLYVESG